MSSDRWHVVSAARRVTIDQWATYPREQGLAHELIVVTDPADENDQATDELHWFDPDLARFVRIGTVDRGSGLPDVHELSGDDRSRRNAATGVAEARETPELAAARLVERLSRPGRLCVADRAALVELLGRVAESR